MNPPVKGATRRFLYACLSRKVKKFVGCSLNLPVLAILPNDPRRRTLCKGDPTVPPVTLHSRRPKNCSHCGICLVPDAKLSSFIITDLIRNLCPSTVPKSASLSLLPATRQADAPGAVFVAAGVLQTCEKHWSLELVPTSAHESECHLVPYTASPLL